MTASPAPYVDRIVTLIATLATTAANDGVAPAEAALTAAVYTRMEAQLAATLPTVAANAASRFVAELIARLGGDPPANDGGPQPPNEPEPTPTPKSKASPSNEQATGYGPLPWNEDFEVEDFGTPKAVNDTEPVEVPNWTGTTNKAGVPVLTKAERGMPGHRRTPQDVEKVLSAIAHVVAMKPGITTTEIRKTLKIEKKPSEHPLRVALSRGWVVKREEKFYPASPAPEPTQDDEPEPAPTSIEVVGPIEPPKASRVLVGDWIEMLRTVRSNSVHMAVTSPPYWGGLRDYDGHRQWMGGDPNCQHDTAIVHAPHHKGQCTETIARRAGFRAALTTAHHDHARKGANAVTHSCSKCGAWYGQLGLEPSLDEFIGHMRDGFRELHRVLRDDGTLWVNIGDAHKDKGLNCVPERLLLALQGDGWIVRQRVIWQKMSCKPETVFDRPTTTHEPIYLLSKSPRYYYDQEAVREPTGANARSVWQISREGKHAVNSQHGATFPISLPRRCILAGTSGRGCCPSCGAQWRRVTAKVEGQLARRTLGWEPTCQCGPHEPIPSTVLDPFAGSGTTLAAAQQLGRHYLGIEINPTYVPLIETRTGTFTQMPDAAE